jgi:hypothetical protein
VSDESELDDSTGKTDELQYCTEEPPVVLDLDKLIDQLKTSTEYKFVYLTYVVDKMSIFFSPYSFKMILFKNIDPQCFFTLSNEGLMSHVKDEITFTPFAEFEEQYISYKKIKDVS